MRIWIDTDVGSDVDDALALALAWRHSELELVGLSTVFGDVALRARIARELTALESPRSAPTIVTGLGAPLTPGRRGRMFGHEGRGLFDDATPTMVVEADPEAPQRIEALANALEEARPDALVAIGPMTNLGALARAGHRLPPLTVMGGKVRPITLPGMRPEIPEWNWWCDPVAIDQALGASAAPPRILPIEVTVQTQLEDEDLERLSAGDPLTRALADLSAEWLVAQREIFRSKQASVRLHDPLAVLSLVEPSRVGFREACIATDDQGVTRETEDGTGVEVATTIDNGWLRRELMDTWLR